MTTLQNETRDILSEYRAAHPKSATVYERAVHVLPSGNSRETIFFEPFPIYAQSGAGCRLTDQDGKEYVDFSNNFTSMIHGHQPAKVVSAVKGQLERLMAVGLPTESEVRLAELLTERIASVEQVRFTNSGTEAVMLAIKVARTYTGRPKIAKIEGAYHGAYDFMEVSVAAAPEKWGDEKNPTSFAAHKGQPAGIYENVIILPWNDVESSRAILNRHADEIAAVIIDPLPSRLAFAPIENEFLSMVGDLCPQIGALFIMDEIYSLRLGYNGAQGKCGAKPDITTMGKIIGGGLPVGAIGGREEIMSVFDMRGRPPALRHGGTYNANPITMTAGLQCMELLTPTVFDRLDVLGQRLRTGLTSRLSSTHVPGHVSGEGSLARLTFGDRPVRNLRDLHYASKFSAWQSKMHRELLNRGVLVSPTLIFALSTPMSEAEIDFALDQVHEVLRSM
jgi:glutamate-1-semialdehyde 2,1-aminomutase